MRILFLCGHKSAYGLSHFIPLLKTNFKMIAIVLSTDKRWKLFKKKLSGENYYPPSRINKIIKNLSKKIIPEVIIQKFNKDYKKPIGIQKIAKEYRTPIWYMDDVNSKEFIKRIKGTDVDLIISAAYPQIFSKELISIPTHGAVNFHPSLLPKFRGAHPHYWSIVKGEEKSGLTAHFITEHIDEGDIIAQIEYPINDYNYNRLYEKIIEETPNLVRKVEKFFLENNQSPTSQDHVIASFFSEPREIHNRIFWEIHSAVDAFNIVRGGNAYAFFHNQKIVFKECHITTSNRNLTNNIDVENGTIVDLGENSIAIKANGGIINMTKIYIQKKVLSASNFIKKYKVLVGEKFD
jgi:methionyl-tRNA formyltransferase